MLYEYIQMILKQEMLNRGVVDGCLIVREKSGVSQCALLVGLGMMYVSKCICNNTFVMHYAGMRV